MIDQIALMAKLVSARVAVDAARRKVAGVDDASPDYQRAQILYLQAMIHHMSLLAVMQAEQQERLWDEVASLREEIAAARRLH